MDPIHPSPQGPRKIPISAVLTCRQLAAILQTFGDLPLMSGRTDYAITGFKTRPDGLPSTTASQVSLSSLIPSQEDSSHEY